ncbi:MAG: protein kinase [Kofleriaceae bacterium]
MFAAEGIDRFVSERYHVVRELGRGGMGVVYLGRDLRRDMDVAIKFRGIMHHSATLWLKREFRAVASLRHRNLVELYELVAHDESCYFTMEYLPGIDPRRWVERASPAQPRAASPLPGPVIALSDRTTRSALPIQAAHTEIELPSRSSPPTHPIVRAAPQVDFGRVRTVLAQLAEGLAFLHARGVIHRDVKPSNALVCDGVVKLLDFGLALEHRRAEQETSRETRVVGTAAYLAPEYAERLQVSPAMDVYALGVVAFELVTGAAPFGGTMHVLARLNRSITVPRASSINPEIPPELDDLIDAMLQAAPERRPSAFDIAARLDGELSQPRQVRRTAAFVGREAELHRMATRIADPRGDGRLVLVTGPSGVGKSALIEEAIRRARLGDGASDVTWRGRCHERERVPYRAFDFVIDDLATELAGNAQLVAQIEHAGAVARVFPSLGALLEDAIKRPPAEDLRVERERALLGMTELFGHVLAFPRGTTSSGPDPSPGPSSAPIRGILVIENLEWADDDSLELLALLVERIARPLTIVATWTTGAEQSPPPAELLERLHARVDVIELGLMSAHEVAQLIAELAPQAATERLAAAAELAAGSPYLAELIGLELADAGLADPHHAEARRLDRLGHDERTVAEIASLAGGAATFDQLRALAELPSALLQSALRGLEDGRIVRSTPTASGDSVYVFYHQRLREAAAGAIATPAKHALHRRFAELLEREHGTSDQLAYHWAEAGEPARALDWAVIAADTAHDQLAWGLAADWYGRAMGLVEAGAERAPGHGRAALRAKRAEALFLGGKLAAAAAEFDTLARAEIGTRGDRWFVRAAESFIKLGEIERGLDILDGVLDRRGEKRARGRALSAARALGVTARWLVPARLRPRATTDEVVAAAYRVIASFLSTPYPIESFEYVVRGISVAERAGDHAAQAMGMAMLAAYLAVGSLGRFGDRAIASAQRLSIESGAPYPRMVAAGAAGILATLRGNWSGMRIAHEEGHQICTRLGLERSWEASFLRTYWALGELYAGEPARALAMLGELADASDDLIARAMLGSYRGRALALAGTDLPAARALERDLAGAPAARRGMAWVYRQVFAGELALAEGDYPRARALGEELERTARAQWLSALPAIQAMIDVVIATAEIGNAAAGDTAAAARAKQRARALHRRGRSSFYAPTALRLWGQADQLLGDPRAARALFARARRIAAVRGGKVDQLAIAALAGAPIDPGPLAFAVKWSTGGVVT